MAAAVLVPLIVFASLFGIIFVWLSTRNKERLALIEKGADASLFTVKRSHRNNYTLKIGMLLKLLKNILPVQFLRQKLEIM